MQDYYLSVVIPAYKEEKRIHKIFDAIIAYQEKADFLIETIVVNDGSPDKLVDTVRKYRGKIPNLKFIDRKENKGKGYSVKEGALNANGKYILFADADNSTPFEQIDKLLKYIGKYDVVIGSRYCKGGKLAHPQPLTRIIGGRVLNLVIQLLATRGIKDTQCGFKLFEHKAAKQIFRRQTFDRFSFDIELLAIARKLGYKTKEVGITWYDDPHSTVKPLKDGIQMIRDAWRVRKNILLGKYR
jgi:glycosyltransferase involved in cell wall biosynthesis